MPDVTPLLALIVFAAGATAGALGAMFGIGGGVFLVPLLNLGLGFPIKAAAAISLVSVIATSGAVTAGSTGRGLINVRLGMVLEVATAAGGVLGGLTSLLLTQAALQRLFGVVTAVVALLTASRINRRNVILDAGVDPGLLGGRFHDGDADSTIVYRVKRIPLALGASFIAGNVSSLLGIGGGTVKVPVLIGWCGVPLRAAAATSAMMIGVTATSGAIIYYISGQLVPAAAAAAILGVQLGSRLGMTASSRLAVRLQKLLLTVVLAIVAVLMLTRGMQ